MDTRRAAEAATQQSCEALRVGAACRDRSSPGRRTRSVLAQPLRTPAGLAPLVAEVKRRVWQRRSLFSALAVLAVVGALAGWLALRSSGGATGLCASSSSGLKERYIPKSGVQEATVVLTNFRFGQMDNFYGLAAGRGTRWPHDGITIAVSNEGPAATPPFKRALRVSAADFQGFEGDRWPTAHVAIRTRGRVLDAYAEVRTVTPAAVAIVNRALAGVRVCSA